MNLKVKVDLFSELDRLVGAHPHMKPYEIRSQIGHIFKIKAEQAGYGFVREIWPVLRKAIACSIGARSTPGESNEDREAREIITYMEALAKHCIEQEEKPHDSNRNPNQNILA